MWPGSWEDGGCSLPSPPSSGTNDSSEVAPPGDAIPSQLVARVLFAWGRESLAARFSRYTAGSIVAFAVSEAALIVFFGAGLVGAAAASVLAFVAGAIPNYFLNRSWVWKRRGRINVHRELVPYVLVSVVTLAVAAIATTAAATIAPSGRGAADALRSGRLPRNVWSAVRRQVRRVSPVHLRRRCQSGRLSVILS